MCIDPDEHKLNKTAPGYSMGPSLVAQRVKTLPAMQAPGPTEKLMKAACVFWRKVPKYMEWGSTDLGTST